MSICTIIRSFFFTSTNRGRQKRGTRRINCDLFKFPKKGYRITGPRGYTQEDFEYCSILYSLNVIEDVQKCCPANGCSSNSLFKVLCEAAIDLQSYGEAAKVFFRFLIENYRVVTWKVLKWRVSFLSIFKNWLQWKIQNLSKKYIGF